jgi:predicted HicB family RNase H-like nuclease
MAQKTAPAKGKKGKAAAKQGKPPVSTVDRDGGLERLYARVTPAVKKIIDAAADADDRSTMKYVERLINKHAEALQKKGK